MSIRLYRTAGVIRLAATTPQAIEFVRVLPQQLGDPVPDASVPHHTILIEFAGTRSHVPTPRTVRLSRPAAYGGGGEPKEEGKPAPAYRRSVGTSNLPRESRCSESPHESPARNMDTGLLPTA